MKRFVFLLCSVAAYPQDFSQVHLEKVATGFLYADGPAWSREGYLLFSDVPRNQLIRLVPGKFPEVFRENTNGAMGNAFDAQGRLYSCESHTRRVVRFDKPDKKAVPEVLAEMWNGKRLNAPNDIAVRKDGAVFFTDPAFGNQQDSRELDFFGVFRIQRKGMLELIAKTGGRPNGIAFAPNGRLLYVTDSDEHKIIAFDLEKSTEAPVPRVVVANIEGVPDGLRTDENGNLYVAAEGIDVYSSDGKPLARFAIPEKPSNCGFGDADFQTLYITALTSLYRLRLPVKGSGQP